MSSAFTVLSGMGHLTRLSLVVCPNSGPVFEAADELAVLPHIRYFSLWFNDVNDEALLLWTTEHVQMLLHSVPSVTHLQLDLPSPLCWGSSASDPISLPSLISIESQSWIAWLLNPSTNFPNLKFLQVGGDPLNDQLAFLDHHTDRIEALALYEWPEVESQFRAMRHLLLYYIVNFPWQVARCPELVHFKFRWFWPDAPEEKDSLNVVAFLDRCTKLEAVSYNSYYEFTVLETYCRDRGLRVVRDVDSFYHDWRTIEHGKLPCAIPYNTWRDVAFYVPPLPPTINALGPSRLQPKPKIS